MKIEIDARAKDIGSAFNWIGGLIGADLDKTVAAFQRHERGNPLLSDHFREHYAFEFALAEARRYRKNTGRLPKGDAYEHLYGFLIPARRIHQALPEAVKLPFEGRLRAALNGAHGIRPFAYEIAIATHLMRQDWDVEFADYTGTGQFDLLARRGSIEIEVECKTTSGDTGRKIHRQELTRLADLILPTTKQLAATAGCHLVAITIPDRLGKAPDELLRIASTVAAAVRQRAEVFDTSCRARYRLADVTSWPEPHDGNGFRDFFEHQFGTRSSHLLLHGRRGHSVAAVMINSAKADSVVAAISRQAKDAADQCSGSRPALVSLNLVDPVSGPELHELLSTANGMHEIAGAVFKGDKRRHVDSVAFTFPQRQRFDGVGGRWLSGDVMMLNNPDRQFICDEARSVFQRSR